MLTFPLTAQRMQTEDLLSKGAVATGHSLVWEWGVWKGGNSQSLFVKIPLWVPLSLPGSANTCLIHVRFPSPYQLPSASLMSITTTPNILFGFSWRWYYSRWGFWPFWWATQFFFFFFFGLFHIYMLFAFCWICMSIYSETNQKNPAVQRKISYSSMYCLEYASIWTYESFDLNTLTSSNAQWWQGWKFLNWKAFLVVQIVKNVPANAGDIRDWAWSLNQGDPLEKGMATHSSTLTWRIPWTEEPGRLQSMESQSVGHDWATDTFTFKPFCKTTTQRLPEVYALSES